MRQGRALACLLAAGLLVLGHGLDAAAGGTLTLGELKALLEVGGGQAGIITLVRDADALAVTEADLARLREWGAEEPLLQAIRERLKSRQGALTLADVLAMAERGTPEKQILDRVLASGERLELSAADKLRLIRAKVGKDVILALEGKLVLPGFRVYRDPLGTFSVQYPEAWRTYEWHTGEGFKILLSPQVGVKRADQFTAGLQIQLSFVGEHDLMKRLDILEYHRRTLPAHLRGNWQYALATIPGPAGEPRRCQLGGYPAVRQDFTATLVGTACRETLVQAVVDEVSFFVEFVAPTDEFARLEETAAKVLQAFRPFPDRVRQARRATPLSPADVLERYREAVVMVRTEFGTGTGFFVRDDGYLLTNHHVICGHRDHRGCTDPSRMKLAREISITWDGMVGPKPPGQSHRTLEGVKLVDTAYGLSPRLDLALLKAPPGPTPYATLPLSPVRSGLVHEADAVAALGFPLPSRFQAGNLFTTAGIITRINYLERRFGERERTRRLNDLFTTAEIQGGNSGGPAVDLVTGGVVGLNTYIALTFAGQELDYFGVCPIDHALRHFPQLRWYPRGRRVGPEHHLELGAMLLAQKNYRPAGLELLRAAEAADELPPELRARLYYQLFVYLQGVERPDEANAALAKCLDVDPRRADALADMAYVHADAGELAQAIACADRLVEVHPDFWWPYYHRAEIYRRAQRLDDAQKDLGRALERGGGFDPALHLLRGRACFDAGELDKGLAAFREALKADPQDVTSRLWIAEYYRRKKNVAGAELEYGRILKDHPDEPAVHLDYGRFLEQQQRRPQALGHLAKALALTLDRSERPSLELLRDIGRLAADLPGQGDLCLHAGLLIGQHWPASRHWAHNLLASYWKTRRLVTRDTPMSDGGRAIGQALAGSLVEWLGEKDGQLYVALPTEGGTARGWIPASAAQPMDALERTHETASERLHPRARLPLPGLAEPPVPKPLSLIDLTWLLDSHYGPELLEETLAATSLGFVLAPKHLEAMRKLQWQPWQVRLVLRRALDDQTHGGPAFAADVAVKLAEGSVHWGAGAPYGTYSFANTGQVPLMRLVLRRTYGGKNNRTLWTHESELDVPDPVLLPGQEKRLAYAYDSYDALKRAGVNTDDITWVRLEPVSACNAQTLDELKFEEARVDGAAYRFRVVNPSILTLRGVAVRVDYVDERGRPIRHRETGAPLMSEPVALDVVLPPKGRSEVFSVTRWAEWAYIAGRGAPADARVCLRPVFVGARLSLE